MFMQFNVRDLYRVKLNCLRTFLKSKSNNAKVEFRKQFAFSVPGSGALSYAARLPRKRMSYLEQEDLRLVQSVQRFVAEDFPRLL